MEGNILKKSRFIIFLKEIYTKDKFSCWLSVCMMLLSTFFVIFLPKLLQYIIDESMRGQQIKYILFFGGLYFFISLFNSLIIIKKEEILVRIKKSTLVRFKTRLLKKVSTLSGKALTEINAPQNNIRRIDLWKVCNFSITVRYLTVNYLVLFFIVLSYFDQIK